MGQKVHPTGIRLGITADWQSKWYADTASFPEYVRQDFEVRKFLSKKLKDASVSRIQIERPAKKVNITLHTARPGIVIGKKGEDIERLRREVAMMLEMSLADVRINIAEIRKPELDATLVAEGIAQPLEPVAHRRLADPELLRGAGHVALTQQYIEVHEQIQVEAGEGHRRSFIHRMNAEYTLNSLEL